jgi:hypothetical protein
MNASFQADLLEGLRTAGIIGPEDAAELAAEVPPPWWLAISQGIAAWIASLMILSSFFVPLMAFGDGPLVRGLSGAVLTAAAIWLVRRDEVFASQMGLALSLAGQALLVSAVAGDGDWLRDATLIAATGLLIATGMLVPKSDLLHRSACALLALSYLAVLAGQGNWLVAYAVLLAAAAVALWLRRSDWAGWPIASLPKAVAHATTVGALVAAWFVGGEAAGGALTWLGTHGAAPQALQTLYPAGVGLVLLATVGWLSRDAAGLYRALWLLAAAGIALAAWRAPGLVVSAAILLAVFQACHRPWIAMALLAALLYLGRLYYDLDSTLLVKSISLAVTGLALLGLRFVLRRWAGAVT